MQKLNGLSTGPFSAKKDVGEGLALKGHKKSPSMGSSKDFSSRPTSALTVKSHNRKTSASSSVYTRVRSTSTVSSTTSRYAMDAPDVPAVPSQLKNRDTTLQDSPTLPHEGQEKGFDFGLQDSDETPTERRDDNKSPERRPSTERKAPEPHPYTHKPRPSVTAAMAPLDSIGSSSSFKSSRSIRGRKASTASTRPTPNELGIKTTPQDPPPVPAAFQKANHASETSNHTPNESTSSNGSYSSGFEVEPPLQESPQRQKPPAFEDIRNDNPFSGFQFDVERKSPTQESFQPPKNHPPLAIHPPSPERTRRPSAPDQAPRMGQLDHGPPPLQRQRTAPPFEESRPYPPPFKSQFDRQGLRYPSRAPSLSTEPTVPMIEPHEHPAQQTSPQQTSPDDYMISSAGSQGSLDHFHFSPAPSRPALPTVASCPPPPQRFRPPDKGICRGCDEPIRGKSMVV
ncbi:uncharacterized protein KY384_008134 [Bacidia gigantensis]|uniref:uncharacterized protein n=1 Tax=Bacidia gigantensis TaxID=2732470 RepID=UPI001D056760|nr:uncharacterized protein KY384_008134 [Bacidia gigantensis]KAG8526705.1 hypothetical protein KY384_008134 [Bacidia gigantensis]